MNSSKSPFKLFLRSNQTVIALCLIIASISLLPQSLWDSLFWGDLGSTLEHDLQRKLVSKKQVEAPTPSITSEENATSAIIPTNPNGIIPIEEVIFPSKLSVREEIQQQLESGADAHLTPPSILLFAQTFAPHMKKALNSKLYAAKVFRKLEECLRTESEQMPVILSSMCLVNARRLARKYPDPFWERFEALESFQPHNARNISNLIEKSVK